jgi:hypothetical protein
MSSARDVERRAALRKPQVQRGGALPSAWRWLGDARCAAAAWSALAPSLPARAPFSARCELAGADAFLKASALRGKARVRHALRGLLLHRPAPRLAEYQNLVWLRAHGFAAPEPLAAGVWRERGLPRHQFLATRWVDAPRFDAAFAAADVPERAHLLELAARTLARLHALGFIHHDAHVRNLLVRGAPAGERELVLLDAWRGGPAPQLRSPSYDLACFLLDAAGLAQAHEIEAFFGHYGAARAAAGAPVELHALAARVARERAALWQRLAAREPERAARLAPRWSPPPFARPAHRS